MLHSKNDSVKNKLIINTAKAICEKFAQEN